LLGVTTLPANAGELTLEKHFLAAAFGLVGMPSARR
jgi:hypothetical protein